MIEQNKYDVYSWVLKVISSSTTIQQLISSKKLIQNFNAMHDDIRLYDILWWEASTRREIIIKKQIESLKNE
jgi:hypothetical protein